MANTIGSSSGVSVFSPPSTTTAAIPVVPAKQHPASAAHGFLIRAKGDLVDIIDRIEKLFPHLAADAPEIAKDAAVAATVATDVAKVAGSI